jgi:hypothetical protein
VKNINWQKKCCHKIPEKKRKKKLARQMYEIFSYSSE